MFLKLPVNHLLYFFTDLLKNETVNETTYRITTYRMPSANPRQLCAH